MLLCHLYLAYICKFYMFQDVNGTTFGVILVASLATRSTLSWSIAILKEACDKASNLSISWGVFFLHLRDVMEASFHIFFLAGGSPKVREVRPPNPTTSLGGWIGEGYVLRHLAPNENGLALFNRRRMHPFCVLLLQWTGGLSEATETTFEEAFEVHKEYTHGILSHLFTVIHGLLSHTCISLYMTTKKSILPENYYYSRILIAGDG